jgi:hypothetical protein
MSQDIQVIIDTIKSATGAGGALAIAAGLVYGAIKILRLNLVQTVLGKIVGPKALWVNWPKWVCMLAVCVVAGVGAVLTALATGTGWLPAIIAGIVAAVAAMGTDSVVSNVAAPSTTVAALPGSVPNP